MNFQLVSYSWHSLILECPLPVALLWRSQIMMPGLIIHPKISLLLVMQLTYVDLYHKQTCLFSLFEVGWINLLWSQRKTSCCIKRNLKKCVIKSNSVNIWQEINGKNTCQAEAQDDTRFPNKPLNAENSQCIFHFQKLFMFLHSMISSAGNLLNLKIQFLFRVPIH